MRTIPCALALAVCMTALLSCASTPAKPSAGTVPPPQVLETPSGEDGSPEEDGAWAFCSSIEDLRGIWECSDGTGFEYPFTADYRTYIRFYEAWQDVTAQWQDMALEQGITVDELWQKRSTIYAWQNPRTGKYASFPVADDGGVQRGVKFYRMAGHVYVREECLITEFVLGKNLRYFLMAEDGERFKTDGTLHLLSSVFPDMSGTGSVYVRTAGSAGQGGK